ncbi:19388_t:CDS:2 [Cetraspora pellucida]|uniref:19388_t:CDS:1 n=1 Tax=Cetraspora pellucida TaxID=1433469 RepID=A0A9N9I0H9_9GLOM|nr:19388_t:CDS:2 [Cetraspora pellucida]
MRIVKAKGYDGSGASVVGINTLANMRICLTYQTVFNALEQIVLKHRSTVQLYVQNNSKNLLIGCIDDYHNLHAKPIPFYSSNNTPIHNPNNVDARLLKAILSHDYIITLMKSYNTIKANWAWISNNIYKNLKNTKQYVKALNMFIELPELQHYLNQYIIPIPADFPEQLYIRRAIVNKLATNNPLISKEVKNNSEIKKKIEGKNNMIPCYYFSNIKSKFSFGALPLGYHTKFPPKNEKFCDYLMCSNMSNYGQVLICSHAYHEKCFSFQKFRCQYCLDYLCDSIEQLTTSYNNRLKMEEDMNDELFLYTNQSKNDDIEDADILSIQTDVDKKLENKILENRLEENKKEILTSHNFLQDITNLSY